MTVIIYSTPSCMYCNMAKEYFKEHNIAYQEFNVAADPEKRKEMVDKSGQLGVPVIDINNQVIVGFDEEVIAEAMKSEHPAASADSVSSDTALV